MALQVITWVGLIAGILLVCRPIQYYWDKLIPGGHCETFGHGFTITAVINLLLDISVIVLPAPIVWKLQMARRRKVAVSLVFSLGAMLASLPPPNSGSL